MYEKQLEEKYPKGAAYWAKFKEVWAETFPDPNGAVQSKMD